VEPSKLLLTWVKSVPCICLNCLESASLLIQAAQGMTASAASSGPAKWRWIFDGGRPANQPRSIPDRSELLYTAHKDGRVRVWGCATAALELHATVPFDSGGAGAKLRAVSALEVLPFLLDLLDIPPPPPPLPHFRII